MLTSCGQNESDNLSSIHYQKQVFNLLSELNIQPKLETINEMGPAKLPISFNDITERINILHTPLLSDKEEVWNISISSRLVYAPLNVI